VLSVVSKDNNSKYRTINTKKGTSRDEVQTGYNKVKVSFTAILFITSYFLKIQVSHSRQENDLTRHKLQVHSHERSSR
jgi:hypothetical protein